MQHFDVQQFVHDSIGSQIGFHNCGAIQVARSFEHLNTLPEFPGIIIDALGYEIVLCAVSSQSDRVAQVAKFGVDVFRGEISKTDADRVLQQLFPRLIVEIGEIIPVDLPLLVLLVALPNTARSNYLSGASGVPVELISSDGGHVSVFVS